MSLKAVISDFLKKHRAKLNPEDYGFSRQNRRVSGLRREEVAQLSAVSVSWYTWLEQGREISISREAVQRIGAVLQLNEVEQQYLEDLIFPKKASANNSVILSDEIIAMVDALNPHPAFVRRDNLDILYWNTAASTQIFDWSKVTASDRNSLKLMFINDEYRKRIFEWEKAAQHTIAAFRAYQAKESQSENFRVIVDDLKARSPEFCSMWDYHDVNKIGSGNKSIINDSGELTHYTYTSLEIEKHPGIYLIFYLIKEGESQ